MTLILKPGNETEKFLAVTFLHPPDIFKVAPAYKGSAQNAKDKALIQTDAWAAHDLAMTGYSEAAQQILLDWALHCREVQGSEAQLVMTFKGWSMLWAWWLMKDMEWNKEVFRLWVKTVYRPCAYIEQKGEENNRASWGILGCVMADMILENDLSPWYGRINRNMAAAINNNGVMKIEVLRTNMGIWYSTFALSAMLKACQLLQHPNIATLQRPLYWLWKYIKNPTTWPYRPGMGIWRWLPWLERRIHPTTDTLELPRANDEAGALYMAAGKQFGVQEWIDYAQRWSADPPFPGVNIYRWVVADG